MITTMGLADELAAPLGIDVELGEKTRTFLTEAGAQTKRVLLVAGGVFVGGALLSAYANWPRRR